MAKRFVYQPDVHAYISTEEYGIIDVSSDIISGSVTRNRDQASSAELILQNPWRKYLRKMKPMDRIVIYLTRIKPVLVFSGYLDRAPVDQLYPGQVTLNATCTLKRLLYTYWDPSLPYVMEFFQANGWLFDASTGDIFSANGKSLYNLDLNGSIGHIMRAVMNQVGGWPIGLNNTNNTVHIMGLPNQFLQKTQSMIQQALTASQQDTALIENVLNSLLTSNGLFSSPFNPAQDSFATGTSTADNVTDANPLPHVYTGTFDATIYGPKVSVGNMPPDGTAWQLALLDYIGAPTTANNIKFINAWSAAEGGLWANNPMNTSLLVGSFPNQPGVSIPEYPNISFGVAMLASTMLNGYPNIVNALQGGDASVIFTDSLATNELGKWVTGTSGPPPSGYVSSEYTSASSSGSTPNFVGADATSTAQSLGPTGIQQMPGGTVTTATSTTDTKDQGNPGDVKVGINFFKGNFFNQSNATSTYTFKILNNPYGDDNMVFNIVGTSSDAPLGGISIYVPGADGSSPQGKAWNTKTSHKVTIESSINQQERYPADSGTQQPAQINPTTLTPAQLSHGGTSADIISSLTPITQTALAFIQSNFGPFKLIQAKNSTIDLVPCDSNDNIDWTPSGVARADALAQWAGWNKGSDKPIGNPAVSTVNWRTLNTGTQNIPQTNNPTSEIVQTALKYGVGSGGIYQAAGSHGAVQTSNGHYVFDCSGYTYQCFAQNGFEDFPSTSETQWGTSSGGNWTSQVVPTAEAAPGDLAFITGSGYAPPGHVGIITDGVGATATVMQYWQSNEPADTILLQNFLDGNFGVKRFFLNSTGTSSSAGTVSKTYTPPPNAHIELSFVNGPATLLPANTGQSQNVSGANVAGTNGLNSAGVLTGQTQVSSIQAAQAASVGFPLVLPGVVGIEEAILFTGERALYLDQPLMEFISFLTKSAGRSFQSLPNGDFMAFFPDYFNWSGQAPYFEISDMETMDLTIDCLDDDLATHVFTTTDIFNQGTSDNLIDQLSSQVASIENLQTFRSLTNVSAEFDPKLFMQRYGARPMIVQDVPSINSSFLTYMYGWMQFLQQWAKLFSSEPTFTFMPELYPGGLVKFRSKDIQFFIDSVTHNFDRESGFTTSAKLICPTSTSNNFNYGMVLMPNGYRGLTQQQPTPSQTDFSDMFGGPK